MPRLSALLLLVLVSCGPRNEGASEPQVPEDPSSIVATERSSRGGRLVSVREDGSRYRELLELPLDSVVIDRSPVFHPSGDWIFFVSNRGRKSVEESDLWVVPFAGGEPVALTRGGGSYRDPRVSSDGAYLLYASNLEGSFDLYRSPFDSAASSLGKPERLTSSPEQELSPSLSPDGSSVVYMQVDGEGRSRLMRLDLEDGADPVELSAGPADLTPSWGPDGRIAFSSVAEGRQDPDLWLMDADGQGRELVVDAYYADITGPRWSSDGRYLFAIGVYRSATAGRPVLGSVVFVDLHESPRRLRALHDQAALESRIGLALRPGALNSTALARAPEYLSSLKTRLRGELLLRRDQSRSQAREDEPGANSSDSE